MAPFRPLQRFLHTATFVNNKLYISGGTFNSTVVPKEFFYLDFSASFDTKELLWQDLSNINKVPQIFGAASAVGGVNNETIFLFGGFSNSKVLIYIFDTQNNSWLIPEITVENTFYKGDCEGITNNGKVYIFGGLHSNTTLILNDMLILDTINLSWGYGSLVNAPVPRLLYGATLLSNQNIIYTGKQIKHM